MKAFGLKRLRVFVEVSMLKNIVQDKYFWLFIVIFVEILNPLKHISMKRMKIMLLSAFMVLAQIVMFSSCSSEEENYLSSLPAESSLVIKVNAVQMVEKSNILNNPLMGMFMMQAESNVPESLNKKADLEKEVALRNQKIQQVENKLKQREMVLNQKQDEVQRKRNEAEAIKENLEAQIAIVEQKKGEWDQKKVELDKKKEELAEIHA